MVTLHKLSARRVQTARKAGRLGDRDGLYLNVTKSGNRSWVFRYRHRGTGRLIELGTGPSDVARSAGVTRRSRKSRRIPSRRTRCWLSSPRYGRPRPRRPRGCADASRRSSTQRGPTGCVKARIRRWQGNLELLLPKRQKLQRGHHPAMPYENVPAFVGRLRTLPRNSS